MAVIARAVVKDERHVCHTSEPLLFKKTGGRVYDSVRIVCRLIRSVIFDFHVVGSYASPFCIKCFPGFRIA